MDALADRVDAIVSRHSEGQFPSLHLLQLDPYRDVKPGGVAAVWLRSTRTPTDCSCGQSRCGLSARMQVYSINPTMKPVANTTGMA